MSALQSKRRADFSAMRREIKTSLGELVSQAAAPKQPSTALVSSFYDSHFIVAWLTVMFLSSERHGRASASSRSISCTLLYGPFRFNEHEFCIISPRSLVSLSPPIYIYSFSYLSLHRYQSNLQGGPIYSASHLCHLLLPRLLRAVHPCNELHLFCTETSASAMSYYTIFKAST